MRIPGLRAGRILARMLGPGQEHLGAAFGDVVVAKVSGVDAAGVDVVTCGRSVGLVEDLYVGPGVLEDLLDVVVVWGGSCIFAGVCWGDRIECLEEAVVESVVGVWSQVDHEE